MDSAGLDALRDMFRYHGWATLTLIDHCAGLGLEQLSGSVSGTRGPIVETLEHLVAADQRYLRRFAVNADPAIREGGDASLEQLRSAFATQVSAWELVLDRLPDFDFAIPADPQADPPWPDAPHARNLVLVQAIHHGNDHRTQICTILGSKGLAVPWLDVWGYWASERIPTR